MISMRSTHAAAPAPAPDRRPARGCRPIVVQRHRSAARPETPTRHAPKTASRRQRRRTRRRMSDTADGGAVLMRYYAVGGRGRPAGAVPRPRCLSVPLGAAPAAPSGGHARLHRKLNHAAWQAAGAGIDSSSRTRVAGSGACARHAERDRGRRTFADACRVRSASGASSCARWKRHRRRDARSVSRPSPSASRRSIDSRRRRRPSCVAFPGGGGIELTWTASAPQTSPAYVVLRGEGTDGTLQRLTAAPITATQYRDQAVRSGVTYTYDVIAIDRATPPNESGRPIGKR